MQRTKLTIVMLAAMLLFSGCMMEKPTVKNYHPTLEATIEEQLQKLLE